MTKLKVWGQPKSINVQKVLWALEELELPFERVDAGGAFGRVRDADYLSLNPNGLVPTLEDGGAALWESNAVVRYLYAKYGKHPQQPRDLAVRARADGWTDWYATTFWLNVRPILVQLVRTPERDRDERLLARSLVASRAAIEVLDRELAKTPYVAGDDFTCGDLPLASAAQRWFNLPIERAPAKNVEAWYARVKERAGFKRWVDLPLF